MITKSELLVSEDEEFVSNFIISEESQHPHTEGSWSGLVRRNILVCSASTAAVGAGVLFSSVGRGALVPAAALATLSGVMLGVRTWQTRQAGQIQRIVRLILTEMTQIKIVMRKSLVLIQSMEMMNSGHLQSHIDGNHQLSRALLNRSSFTPLRRAIYHSSVDMILFYRFVCY